MLRSPLSHRLAVLLLAGLAGSAHALPERLSADAQDALARLKSNTGGALAHKARPSVAYTLLRAQPGRTLMADNAALPATDRARLFLSVYGAALGMDSPSGQVALQRVSRDPAGNAHVHLDQVHDGVPVLGARVVVHMNRAGITGVSGVFVPGLEGLSTEPARELSQLRAAALGLAAKHHPTRALRIDASRYVVYPEGLLQGRLGAPRLAYEALVTSGADVRERIYVDARDGTVLNRIDEIHRVLNREIYTPDQSVPPYYTEGSLVPPAPSDPPLINDPGHNGTIASDVPGNPPADNLYIFAGGTYKLYENMFGRQGYDWCDPAHPEDDCTPDAAQVQKSVYLINDACPNAYWNGDSTNYCPGFDADDVVSHEWTHAYTQYTHGLIYQYQSGALNESWSDIFGESYDLVNKLEGPLGSLSLEEHKYYEEGGSRWVVGEDLSDEAAAALLRDMWKPDDFCGTALCARNPGKATSENYSCGSGDNGGVHANSSVSNHAFAMLVDGTAGQGPEGTTGLERDSYNGQSFTGIGLVKALHIYYHAMMNYQVPSTDFPQHADALRQSCADLTGVTLKDPTGANWPSAISAADCEVLNKAMLATEMDLGTPCPYLPVLQPGAPAICAGANTILLEDWESGDDGWTKTSTGEFAEWEDGTRSLRDFVLNSALPNSRPGTAAFAANIPLGQPGGGDCSPGTGDYSGQYTYDGPEVTIPAGADDLHLRFDHYVATEATFDGGQIEISVNGGAFELVPVENYAFNRPNSALEAAPPVGLNTNPNAGELAWNGTDVNAPSGSPPASWGTTIVDLNGLAAPGDTVRLRLTFSQDGCNGVEGWYVDDVHLYSCPLLEPPTLALGSDYENPDTNGIYTLSWVRPAGATGPDLIQTSESSCAPLLADDAEGDLGLWDVTTTGSGAQPWTIVTGQKPQHDGRTFFATATENSVNTEAILTTRDPVTIPAAGTTTLSFQDWNVNEGDDNVYVEVSPDGTTWTQVYLHNRSALAPDAASFFATELMFDRTVDLTPYAGQSLKVRFRFLAGPENRAGSSPMGWYLDNIAITNEAWSDLVSLAGVSHTLTGQVDGSRCYRVRTTYTVNGNPAPSRYSNIVTATVDGAVPPPPDVGGGVGDNRLGGSMPALTLLALALAALGRRRVRG